jgi:beta-fructofuranosidase
MKIPSTPMPVTVRGPFFILTVAFGVGFRTLAQSIAAPSAMPAYHFTSPSGHDCMPFDPNGAVYFKGRYHLGYIYQEAGRHFWGHVSTTDLIHWQMHPPMLAPGPESGIFSGNAFIDKKGRVVLSYHGLGNDATKVPGGNCLAIAQDDDLNVFKKLPGNPVMKNPGWDPHTWLEGDTYYSISGGNPGSGNPASLYTSTDDGLANWQLLGPLMSHEMPDVFANEDISCPDLFKLGSKHILLCISHARGARYYVGRFESQKFHPEAHYRMNWPGGTCFAPETLLDAQGRRIMWAWVLGTPSTMTLPRVLSMAADGAMHIEPVDELKALRKNPKSLRDIDVPAQATVPAEGISGDCQELQVTIDPQLAAECGVKVRSSPDRAEETAINYIPGRRVLSIELNKSSLNKSVTPRTYAMTFMLPKGAENPEVSAQEAPFSVQAGELLNLHIYLDHSILEVFANGRQCLTQRIWPTRADSQGVSVFARGGSIKVKSLEAWDMGATSLSPLARQAQ